LTKSAFALVSIGLFSLLLATLENRQNVRSLGTQYRRKQRSLAVIVAALLSLLGVVALRDDFSPIAVSCEGG